jgi:hypothetical protein
MFEVAGTNFLDMKCLNLGCDIMEYIYIYSFASL